MTGISAKDMERVTRLEGELEAAERNLDEAFASKDRWRLLAMSLEEVLKEFAHPQSTGRSPDGGDTHPEKDIMSVRVEMKTWFRMKLLLGEMDIDGVKTIMPHARPSEEFIKELEEFAEKTS